LEILVAVPNRQKRNVRRTITFYVRLFPTDRNDPTDEKLLKTAGILRRGNEFGVKF